MNKKYYALFLLCLTAAIGLNVTDSIFEIRGVLARYSDYWDRAAYIGACIAFHIALLVGPMRLHSTRRHLWAWGLTLALIVVPYSIIQSLAGQRTAIEANNQASQLQEQVVEMKRLAAESALQSARVKQSYGYASRSDESISQANQIADQLSVMSDSIKISNEAAYSTPLAIMNFFLSIFGKKPLSPSAAVLYVNALMCVGFVVLSSLFAVSAAHCYQMALSSIGTKPGQSRDNVPEGRDIRTIKDLDGPGHGRDMISDEDVRHALRDFVRDNLGTKAGKSAKINRATVQGAIRRKYGKAIKASRADAFIQDLQAMVEQKNNPVKRAFKLVGSGA